MIKKAKKSVAVGLSVALAVTSVNIPVNSASAAAKKAKLSATKKTLTAGKSTTLTLKTNKKKAKTIKSISAKYVKVSTSKKSVATVKKVSKKSKFTGVKVTAKKAGKSTITVKVTKGTYKGTYKCTVTVKKKASATKAPTQKPTEAPTATPEVTVEPTQAPTQAPTQEPTAEPTTAPAISPDVQVKAAKVEGNVTNSIADYDNTVLANQTATVKFKVTDAEGKAVKNETVTVTLDTDQAPTNSLYAYGIDGESKRVAVVTTDSEGIARVVLAPKNDCSSATAAAQAVASYTLTAVCSTDETVKNEVKVSVGAIVYDSIKNIDDASKKFKKGTNATNTNTLQSTKDLAGRDNDYVATQQVSSSTNKVDNSLTFNTAVSIKVPGTTKTDDKATKYVQNVNFKSSKYDIYAKGQYNPNLVKDIDFDIDKDVRNNVAYATLYFNNISISKHTKLTVVPYTRDAAGKVVPDTAHVIKKWVNTGYKTSGQGLQISKDIINPASKYVGIRVVVDSEGQVNTDQNDGFDIKDLTYVYDTKTVNNGDTKPLKSVTVNWETVTNPVFSTEAGYSDATYGTDIVKEGETATYTVPVFPYVGNGIITVKDSNKNIVRYYAVPTKNVNNENVIATTAASTTNKPYLISADEAKNINPGTFKVDGTKVTVDSEKSGTQYLKATITSTDKNIVLDAKNSELYTSVMWNPIEKAAATTDSSAFFALEGQKVDVIAQLVDNNGNKVTTSDVGIKFYDENGEITKNGAKYGNYDALHNSAYTAHNYKGYATVTDLTNSGKTDKNGQVKLTLEGTDAVDLVGLKAESSTSKYNVVLVIADTTVNNAEVHWARVGLAYKPEIDAAEVSTVSDGTKVVDQTTTGSYEVNQNWEVGTYTNAEFPRIAGKVANDSWYHLDVSGLKIAVKAGDDTDAVGKVEASSTVNGMAIVSSDKGGSGSIINAIDKSSVSNDVKFNYNYTGDVKNAGYGDSSIDEKLTIKYAFGSNTVQATNVLPMGNVAAVGTTKVAYIKVNSVYGDIAKNGRTVELEIPSQNCDAYFSDVSGVTSTLTPVTGTVGSAGCTKVTAQVNSDGIVAVGITDATAEKVKLTAALLKATTPGEYDTTGAKCDETYEFKSGITALAFDTGKVKNTDGELVDKISYNNNSITLVFNDDILATSVVKGLFNVKYAKDGATDLEYTKSIDNVKVDGKKVIISYASDVFAGHGDESKLTVEVAPKTVKGIQYTLTSKSGSVLEDTLTYTLKDGAKSAKATAAAADQATATPIVAALNAAITAKSLSDFDSAYATYDGATNSVKAIVDAQVTNLATLKAESTALAAAKAKVTGFTALTANTYANGTALNNALKAEVANTSLTVTTDKDAEASTLTAGAVVVTIKGATFTTTETITLS